MRSSIPIYAVFGVAVGATSAIHVERVSYASTNAVRAAEVLPALPAASLVTELTTKVPRPKYKQALLHGLLKSTKGAALAGSGGDSEYLVNITIGGQSFKAIVDTGSSDTWLVEKGFKCFNLTSYPEPSSECAFGSKGFDPKSSKTFRPFPNHNFNISYGDGEFLTGAVGFDTVTVGDLIVTSQEIGVVDKAAWTGDGVNSGLLGLAFPGLTSVFNGTNPNNDSGSNIANYDPFFFTAVKQKKVSQPIFSVVLNRGTFANQENSTYDNPLGYLAFGGVAPVPVTSTAVTVPIQGYHVSSAPNTIKYFFYNIDVDSYVFPGSNKLSTNGSAILDTGTTLNYLPDPIARAFNAKFVPPATYNKEDGYYYVNCKAQAPSFAVTIGGKTFGIDGRDNIVPSGTDDNGKELCISGTQGGGTIDDGSIFILGDVFLHNVVSTFNIDDKTVRLDERSKY